MALIVSLVAACLALGAAAPHAQPPAPPQAWSLPSPPEDAVAPASTQDDYDEPLVRERRQTAGRNAENLGLRHDTPLFRDGHVNVNEGTNSLHYGGGVGAVLGRSADGRHSLGAAVYGQQSVVGGDTLSFSHPNLGIGAGYRYNGDKTSVALGAHKQTFGGGVTEHGGSLNLEHRLNNRHSLFGGVSRSKINYPGPFSQTDTNMNLGYRLNLNDRTSLSLGGHRSNSDFGPFGRRSNHGFNIGIRHRF
ncbi:uncharacterized protein LOC122266685 isoform X2 [Penaeus japonicus]|uniref:uncharacterized protein LOC122266685 isoform X2 n=1 Tax=Penaeus japonicus TaxID=27405 RepID=UPI001C70FD3F|nr:uncharacterized protein LOC122266685 isoform X2 [Penaeus japonicus]